MRRLSKSKKNFRGFSLVEMLIVVGIIMILAGVIALGVNDVMNPAKRAQSSVKAEANKVSNSVSLSESVLAGYGF